MRRLLFLLLLAAEVGPAWTCSLSLRWSADPPYSQRGADGQPIGLEVEIQRELLRRIGCTPQWRELPFGRALLELEQGRLDLLPGAFRRPEREAYAWFSSAVLQAPKRLYLRRADLPGFGARSLREWLAQGHRLGVLPGVAYGPDYAEILADPGLGQHLQVVVKRHSLWQMLARGRIAGMLADEITARHELAQLGLQDEVAAAPLSLRVEPSHTAFSKRSVEQGLVLRYDRALAEMRRDGSLERMLGRYRGP